MRMPSIRDRLRWFRREYLSRRVACAVALPVCVCLAAIVGAALLVPCLHGAGDGVVSAQYGSSIFFEDVAGYFVTGFIAFLLGVVVTLLSLHLKKRQGGGDGKP